MTLMVMEKVIKMLSCRCWETLMVFLIAYSAWVYPFEVAFMNASAKGGLLVADNVIDLFFAIDIVLTFFVAYIDSRTHLLVLDQKKIAIRFALFCSSLIKSKQLNNDLYITCTYKHIYLSLRYLSTWFIMDVASTIPFEGLGYLITGQVKSGLSYSLLGMLRLWRLRKVKQFFTR